MDNSILPYGKRSKKPDDYRALAALKGLEWIGPYTGKVIEPTEWRCSRGHEFLMPYSTLLRPVNGCPKCNRYQAEDYHALAHTKGFEWLGPEVCNTGIKTKWRCSEGHEWEISLNGLKGCPVCRYNQCRVNSKHTNADYHQLAKERDLEWLGPEVPNAATQTGWRCSHGHTWDSTYNVVRRSKMCPACYFLERSEQKRIKPEQYTEMAKEHNLKWLGPEVKGVMQKTWWECTNSHKWFAPYDTIRKGTNCPECLGLVNGRKASKPQKILCDMVGGELNYKIGRCTADIVLFVDLEKIAIEYDCYYWHAKTQENDRRRAEYMIRRGWRVLSVKSNIKLPSLTQMQDAIQLLVNGQTYQ